MAFARIVLSIGLVLAFTGQVPALERIYLVRHAEKVEHWPEDPEVADFRPLDARGVRRAKELATLLGDEGIEAVYASATTRSLATAMPLSERTGVDVIADRATVDPDRMERFLQGLREKHSEARAVLIVGHLNTLPELLVRLGATPECFEAVGVVQTPRGLRVQGYDGLWQVELGGEGCSRITRRDFPLSDRPRRDLSRPPPP